MGSVNFFHFVCSWFANDPFCAFLNSSENYRFSKNHIVFDKFALKIVHSVKNDHFSISFKQFKIFRFFLVDFIISLKDPNVFHCYFKNTIVHKIYFFVLKDHICSLKRCSSLAGKVLGSDICCFVNYSSILKFYR